MSTATEWLGDSVAITKRNLIKVKRVPDLIVFSILSPIMFVLLFVYVFGSAIPIEGLSYAEFLLPGIFAQTVLFGASFSGTSIAEDLQKGLIDRFRSLPMARSSVLVGRTVADIGLNAISIVVMALTGLLVGWRIRSSVPEALLGFVLLLLFAFAMSWVMVIVGMLVRTPEVFNNASFIVIFPLTFIANTFVPTEGFPSVLKAIADWNPISSITQASRDLFGNTSALTPVPDVWPMQHPVVYTLIWIVVILAVCIPLAVRQYLRTALR
ncbi:ABC transporter permease [Nakamurella sp. YIM 132087]|uniref:Transport permease protein n=1 Tax=Nakamurella alba TaxID=2665158 RepID=A0A7K1FJB8_9ACTN|nr:ABC transporter permease [Nakamurella alba]MTD14235.1 ABC transporter permease [Nakamurella alba]